MKQGVWMLLLLLLSIFFPSNVWGESGTVAEVLYNHEQYEILKRCSEKSDISEWNTWLGKQRRPKTRTIDPPTFDGLYIAIMLQDADLEGMNLRNADLRNAYMQRAQLWGTDLQSADLFNAKLQRVTLGSTNLESADLRYAQLQHAVLYGSIFHGAKLSEANLQEAHCSFVQLQGVYMQETNLQGASFVHAYLQGTNLRKSDLRGASFTESTLQGANFSHAITDNTTFFADDCEIDEHTDFTGVGLDSIRISPELNIRLKDNIRRLSWQRWYDKETTDWFERNIARFFWSISNYGSSMIRVFYSLVLFILAFAMCYTMIISIYSWQCYRKQQLRRFCRVSHMRYTLQVFFYAFRLSLNLMIPFKPGSGHIDKTQWSRKMSWVIQTWVYANLGVGYLIFACFVTRISIMFQALSP